MEGMAANKEHQARAVEAGVSPEAGRRCRGARAPRCSASTEEVEAGQSLAYARCTARKAATSGPTTPSRSLIFALVVPRRARSAEASQLEEGSQGAEGLTSFQRGKEGRD